MAELRPRHRSVLQVLAAGPARQTQVAAELWPGKARRRRGLVQLCFSEMWELGLVEREPDGRHALTEQGRALIRG